MTREIFERAGMTGAGFFDRRDSVPPVAEGWDLVDGSAVVLSNADSAAWPVMAQLDRRFES